MNENTDTEPTNPTDDNDFYVLRLFVTGASVNSIRAVVNVKEICETYIKDKYSLEIIDVHQQKSIAEQEQIIALPLLIKTTPLPARRLIGDMSDTQKVLKGLGISIGS
ncbi:circadian clock KaiB family protein [Dyadobacter chenwenxiniae]|uniref:Circadian clock KaiB family protein n=1 Tax=Dyadobacter chenwenxiniae TaxID=2906456 RepID=A0A9X1PK32_9BACT|nr:circadian clock KaiB family protein [Dyadobacter chenwenxiniae]MCF0052875.1 circadian clock KaiB family protein [Dyadobacter chenwenxiniae]MCF0060186.1 circadian clock KaiB family protein [Dyadobacter chenwenxiniae]UON85923.1 circadian clock KaiB family protein [Dyadobacter chenwenxiniae]